jgi:DNA-binding protein H-NS
MIDLDSLSLDELKKLQKDVKTAITNFETRELKRRLEKVEAFAREQGLTQADLSLLLQKKTRRSSAGKFANPDDPSQTWTGLGRRPQWFIDATARGITKEQMAI